VTVRAKKGGGGPKRRGGGGTGEGGGGERHPIHQGIEKLYAAGKTPRIRLDARRNDVIVPDHVRARWQENLVIDLDPGYPLNLVYDDGGLHVDLAFAGRVSRCSFPWQSIYGLFDRASGQGVQIASHLPLPELPESLRVASAPAVPRLRAISSVPSSKPKAKPTAPVTKETAVDDSDELAKARRAKFRVINGG
jgi:hypothetical protein